MAYCIRADLEMKYGKTNVQKWADLDGSADKSDIDARIMAAIATTAALLEDRLRGGIYALPLVTPLGAVPEAAKEINTLLAGVYLYENRGVKDIGPDGKAFHQLSEHKKMAERMVNDILSYNVILDAVLAAAIVTTTPTVIQRDPDTDEDTGSSATE